MVRSVLWSLSVLPNELIYRTLSFLDGPDLAAAALACPSFLYHAPRRQLRVREMVVDRDRITLHFHNNEPAMEIQFFKGDYCILSNVCALDRINRHCVAHPGGSEAAFRTTLKTALEMASIDTVHWRLFSVRDGAWEERMEELSATGRVRVDTLRLDCPHPSPFLDMCTRAAAVADLFHTHALHIHSPQLLSLPLYLSDTFTSCGQLILEGSGECDLPPEGFRSLTAHHIRAYRLTLSPLLFDPAIDRIIDFIARRRELSFVKLAWSQDDVSAVVWRSWVEGAVRRMVDVAEETGEHNRLLRHEPDYEAITKWPRGCMRKNVYHIIQASDDGDTETVADVLFCVEPTTCTLYFNSEVYSQSSFPVGFDYFHGLPFKH